MFGQQILRTSRNAAAVRAGQRAWFKFENLAGGEVRVDIFDEISWFGITAADFNRELRAIPASSTIALHLNSPGGDVFDGIAIYNSLKQHQARVNVTVDGIAASIASVIAMAGDSVTMSQGSLMMIHEPFALVVGNSADMRKQADALDVMGDSIAGIYASRAGGDVADWRAAMEAETWYGDQQAVDAGLADSVGETVAAKNSFDLSIFRNGPMGATPPSETKEETDQPVMPDWRTAARRRVAAAQMEVIHGYGH